MPINRGVLKYERVAYIPSYRAQLEAIGSEKELRREYTRLRDIARKRLQRLESSEFVDTSETYKQNKKGFKTIKQLINDTGNIKKTQFARELSKLARFLSSPTSTVSGIRKQRKKALQTLEEHGYTFVNEENFDRFTKAMEEFRTRVKENLRYNVFITDLDTMMDSETVTPNEILEFIENYERSEKE